LKASTELPGDVQRQHLAIERRDDRRRDLVFAIFFTSSLACSTASEVSAPVCSRSLRSVRHILLQAQCRTRVLLAR
jgi:hypothetical protein